MAGRPTSLLLSLPTVTLYFLLSSSFNPPIFILRSPSGDAVDVVKCCEYAVEFGDASRLRAHADTRPRATHTHPSRPRAVHHRLEILLRVFLLRLQSSSLRIFLSTTTNTSVRVAGNIKLYHASQTWAALRRSPTSPTHLRQKFPLRAARF